MSIRCWSRPAAARSRMASRTAPAFRQAFAALTIALPFNDVEAVRARFARTRKRSRRSFSSRFRPTPGFIFRSEDFLEALREECTEARRAADLRRSDDRIPRRARRRAGNLRHQAGSDRARQSHRRRPAGGRVWRARGDHGSAVAGRSGLPGRHAYRAIRSRWPRGWRSCASWSASMAGELLEELRRAARRSDHVRSLARVEDGRSRFIASARCSACSSRRVR